jgi:hypothetical protein
MQDVKQWDAHDTYSIRLGTSSEKNINFDFAGVQAGCGLNHLSVIYDVKNTASTSTSSSSSTKRILNINIRFEYSILRVCGTLSSLVRRSEVRGWLTAEDTTAVNHPIIRFEYCVPIVGVFYCTGTSELVRCILVSAAL